MPSRTTTFVQRTSRRSSAPQATARTRLVAFPRRRATAEANFNAAGWTLAILYENANLPTRSLSLFLGLEPQGGATASVTGICTPDKKGQLRARVAVSAVEGDTNDPNDTRDSLRFGPSIDLSPDQFRLSGPNNPAANFFASQINRDDGELDTRGTFGDRNNDFLGIFLAGRQGWDITNVDASAQLVVGQTTAFAQGTAEFDDFFINALAMQIEVVAPVFDAEGATSVSSSTAQVGDVLTYTVEIDNKGGATGADNVVLTVPLPAGMSFVAGSFTLDGIADPGANPITGATIGTVAPKASREATFQLRVDAIPVAPASARYQVTPTWTYTFVGCVGQTPQPASSTSNTVTTEIARITAAKSASASSIRPDETLTYTIATLNSGTAASHDTLVTDAIPTGTTYRPNTTTLNGVAVADQLGTSPLVVGMLVNSAAVAFKPSRARRHWPWPVGHRLVSSRRQFGDDSPRREYRVHRARWTRRTAPRLSGLGVDARQPLARRCGGEPGRPRDCDRWHGHHPYDHCAE